MTRYFLLTFALSLAVLTVPAGAQVTKTDLAKLRASFAAATSKDFEIVKNRIVEHDDGLRGGTYVLIHVRPRQSGIYQLKYSYRVRDKFYYKGESEFLIRVGGRTCDRDLRTDIPEKTMFCLGDTVIIPLRVENTSSASFDLRSTYQKALETGNTSYPVTLGLIKTPPINNPLEANMIYHGYRAFDQLSRSATGGGTIWHDAVFEARAPGRFNLGLGKKDAPVNVSVPVIIVKPGTPITAIAPFEQITDYTKGRGYSSTNRKSYQSRFLILQAGDTWSETYSTLIIPDSSGGDHSRRIPEDTDPGPVITALPFELKRSEDFYNWVADYLPDGK
jgi:hypothetical protein